MQEKVHMCKKHNRVLTLFCENERELVCAMCIQDSAHQGHLVRSVTEAASHHRQKLTGYIEPLKKQLVELKKLIAIHDRKLLELKDQAEKHMNKLEAEFEQLNDFVEHEQEAMLCRLKEEDKDMQHKLAENFTQLSLHAGNLTVLLEELAEKSVMSKGNLLREVKSIKQKWDAIQSPTVWTVQFKRKDYYLPPLYSELEKIVKKFKKEVTLDPQTAHPSLCISEDRKNAVYVKSNVDEESEQSPDDVVVLGSAGYSSGRHYWEVQVGKKPEWAVGVCTVAPCSKGERPLSGQNRTWTIQLQNGAYLAGGSVPVLLSLKEKPTEIGIYLDYELGQVSFYNASNRSYIHSLIEPFSDVLKPYFRVGKDGTPLTVREVGGSTECNILSSDNFWTLN